MSQPRLPRSTPEAEGVPSSAVAALLAGLDELRYPHAMKLLRHGRVIAEAAWSPYEPQRPHSTFSISKSFTSMAIGLLVHEGRLSLDDLVVDLLPDDVPAEPSPHLRALRVRHVLDMTVGHEVEPFPGTKADPNGNWAQFILSQPIPREPGTHWIYNTPSTYLLSCIVTSVTGGRMLDYLTPRLFEPLGIEHPTWEQSPQGVDTGGFGLSITIEDLAVFGQFLLQRGQWNGVQLVPAEWIDEATAAHADNDNRPEERIDWKQGYGYQFWRCRHGAYRAEGAFGQFVVVMPEQDAVLVTTGGVNETHEVLEVLWKLLPAFDTEGPAAELVSGRALELPPGELRERVVEHRYDGHVQRLRIVGDRLETDAASFTLTPGAWSRGEFLGQPVAVAGGWTGDTFEVLIRMLETPFSHILRLQPDGHLSISTDHGFDGPEVLWSGDPVG